MKLFTKCHACRKDFFLKKTALTRPDLENELGEKFRLQCTHCQASNQKKANDIRATENKIPVIIAAITGIVLAIIFFFLYFWLVPFMAAIPLLIWQQQRAAVNLFNTYRLRQS